MCENYYYQGYYTENYTENYEYEITSAFPVKPRLELQKLLDMRLQLLLQTPVIIKSGETRKLPTTCIITPHHGWILATIPNPALTLISHESCLAEHTESYRLQISVTNTTKDSIHLPSMLCIGYLILKCNSE